MIDAIMRGSLQNQLSTRRSRIEDIQAESGGRSEDLVHLLKEVDSALDRLSQDGFGKCEFCGDPVGDDFLTANPMTNYCLCDLTPEQQDALGQDLTLAGRIQAGLLPEQDAAVAGWETHYRYLPAGPVSGDYVDLVNQENSNNLFLLLGDVSGKGGGGIVLDGSSQCPLSQSDPDGASNQYPGGTGKRDFQRGAPHPRTTPPWWRPRRIPLVEVEICNAGHFPPLLLQGKQVTTVDSTGFPVGMFDRSPLRRLQNSSCPRGYSVSVYRWFDRGSERPG